MSALMDYDSRRSNTRGLLGALLFQTLVLSTFSVATAHPVSLTETTVYVQREKMMATVGVFVEDLYLFHGLKPNQENRLEPADIEKARDAHAQFLLDRFTIRNAAGEPLRGRLVEIKGFEMPPDGISLDELMSFDYAYHFEYETGGPLEFATFSQQLVDETQGIPAEMQLRVKQEGSESAYAAILNGSTPVTVRFDWDRPPLSPDASDEEWEKWLNESREETLGITSYSSVYSFIYITDKEVRHEILVPLATLQSSVLIPRRDMAFLEVDEQPDAAEQIGAYYKSGNPVIVDGQQIDAVVQRVDFYGVDFRDFAQQAPKRRVSMASARAGVILSYPLSRPPQTVEVEWDRFNQHVFSVIGVVYAYDDMQRITFARQGNAERFKWINPGRPPLPEIQSVATAATGGGQLKVPAASLAALLAAPLVAGVLWICGAGRKPRVLAVLGLAVLAVALWPTAHIYVRDPFQKSPQVDEQTADALFAQLHTNIYRAFDYTQEDDIYDALARSVDGALLQDLYLQIQRGLAMQEQGGAISTIADVKLIDGDAKISQSARPEDGFDYRCRWTVKGTVEHWGHIHARTNEYEAVFHVAARDANWKITEVELLGEKRVDFETGLRGT